MATLPQTLGLDIKQAILVDYTNDKGERRLRKVIPVKIYPSTSIFRPPWIMEVYDLDKSAFRSFSFVNIHGFKTL